MRNIRRFIFRRIMSFAGWIYPPYWAMEDTLEMIKGMAEMNAMTSRIFESKKKDETEKHEYLN